MRAGLWRRSSGCDAKGWASASHGQLGSWGRSAVGLVVHETWALFLHAVNVIYGNTVTLGLMIGCLVSFMPIVPNEA